MCDCLIFRKNKVDISECRCNEVLAAAYHQLVCHWKAAGNQLKIFHYLIESAAAFISVHSNMQALSFLNEVETIIMEAENNPDYDETFFISTEDKARVAFLYGQVVLLCLLCLLCILCLSVYFFLLSVFVCVYIFLCYLFLLAMFLCLLCLLCLLAFSACYALYDCYVLYVFYACYACCTCYACFLCLLCPL